MRYDTDDIFLNLRPSLRVADIPAADEILYFRHRLTTVERREVCLHNRALKKERDNNDFRINALIGASY